MEAHASLRLIPKTQAPKHPESSLEESGGEVRRATRKRKTKNSKN